MTFTVLGIAAPAGSKRALLAPGATRPVVVDANAKTKPWQAEVRAAAAEAMAGISLLEGPLALSVQFIEPRPKSHYGTGRNAGVLKKTAPNFPAKKPDLLKLGRAVEDAMKGVVFRDDSQFVDEYLKKRWGEPARCEVEVKRMPLKNETFAEFVRRLPEHDRGRPVYVGGGHVND